MAPESFARAVTGGRCGSVQWAFSQSLAVPIAHEVDVTCFFVLAGQAKTLEFARQERLRLELLEEDERALARGNHRGTANMTRLTVAEDPSANPLLWLQDGAIGRSSYVADYLHAPTFHQQFIERALTNAPKDNGLSSDVSSYGGEAGLIKRAVEQVCAFFRGLRLYPTAVRALCWTPF